jgi:hypothetical protein
MNLTKLNEFDLGVVIFFFLKKNGLELISKFSRDIINWTVYKQKEIPKLNP